MIELVPASLSFRKSKLCAIESQTDLYCKHPPSIPALYVFSVTNAFLQEIMKAHRFTGRCDYAIHRTRAIFHARDSRIRLMQQTATFDALFRHTNAVFTKADQPRVYSIFRKHKVCAITVPCADTILLEKIHSILCRAVNNERVPSSLSLNTLRVYSSYRRLFLNILARSTPLLPHNPHRSTKIDYFLRILFAP